MLTVTDLHVAYGSTTALGGASLHVAQGGAVAVLGANGAGKSSLVRAVSGLVPIRAGRVEYDGNSLVGRSPHEIARLGVGHVREGHHVFPRLSVAENLDLGGWRHRGATPEDLERVRSLFPVLAERWQALAGTLSGGQQQMLAIARALVGRPRLLLLDEPSLGLAPLVVAQVSAAIGKLVADGMTLLLVEQDAALALALTDHAVVLERGEVVLSGTAAELRRDERVLAAYLGVPSAGATSTRAPDGDPGGAASARPPTPTPRRRRRS